MNKIKAIQSLIGILVFAGLVYWNIFSESQRLIWEPVSDILVVLTLLGFGEIFLYTAAVGVARFISKAIPYKKNNSV